LSITRPAPEAADDDVRDRARARHRHLEQILLRRLAGLADGVGHFVGLAESDADASGLIAHRDDGVEREPPTPLSRPSRSDSR
jgi:hypothetical protein